MMALAKASVRCGVTDAHDTTPASLISRMRSPMSSGLIGSL